MPNNPPSPSQRQEHSTMFLPLHIANGTNCFYLRMSNGKYAVKTTGDDATDKAIAGEIMAAVNAHAALLAERDGLRKALGALLLDAVSTWEVMKLNNPSLKHVSEPAAIQQARAQLTPAKATGATP